MQAAELTSARIAEIAQAIVDHVAATFATDRPSIPFGASASELLGLTALAAAGRDSLERFTENAERLRPEPGDLIVVRAPADTPADFHALQAGLEALAHALRVRVIAIDSRSTLEVVPASTLCRLAGMLEDRAPRGVTTDEVRARIVAEAAGELGLAILRAQRP